MKYQARSYVARPRTVRAIEWNGDDTLYKFLVLFTGGEIQRSTRNILCITSNDKTVEVRLNDYIVRTEQGELVVFAPEIFERAYGLANWELERDSDMWPEPVVTVTKATDIVTGPNWCISCEGNHDTPECPFKIEVRVDPTNA